MEEGETEDIVTVEVRLSDVSLAHRLSAWIESSAGFEAGAASGPLSVMVADHVPDDAASPLIILAEDDGLNAPPSDPRVAARLSPATSFTKLRIAIEAAAYGLSVSQTHKAANVNPAAGLTVREREVLGLLAEGASNKAIARRLGISAHTVKFHVAAILEKLGASTRTGAAMEGVRLGLLML